jgi:fatty-acyl-CoA synthase
MAALVVDGTFDFAILHAHLAARLPSYARPLFIRLCPALETTGTFRLRKVDLAREGYDASSDPVWKDDGTAFLPT